MAQTGRNHPVEQGERPVQVDATEVVGCQRRGVSRRHRLRPLGLLASCFHAYCSALSMARSLASVSSHSVAGSEPWTMPAPA